MTERSNSTQWHILLLALFLLSLGGYIIVRHAGLWGENDMAVLAELIQGVVSAETILPTNAYTQGYGYPALGAAIVHITGVETAPFQMLLVPLLVAWIAIPAWLFYHEILRDKSGATLAAVLFFIQPEVLFVLLRSSHEKFTRGLMLFGLYLLLRSFRSRHQIGQFAAFVTLFYICCYALITFNNLIATSYIVGVGLAVAILGLSRSFIRADLTPRFFRRFASILTVLLLLAFLFTFYIYEPARLSISLFSSMFDRVAVLLFNVVSNTDASTVNPYQVVNTNWINTPVYLLISIANWLMLAVSGLLWLSQTVQLLFRKRSLSLENGFLWSLFTAFAILTAGGILVDTTGFLGANLQLRIFPAFSMLGAPLIAQWWRTPTTLSGTSHRLYASAGAIAAVSIALLSVIKATNEPLVSNYWVFATKSELAATEWAYDHVESGELWTDYTERVDRIYRLMHVHERIPTDLRMSSRDWQARALVISSATRARSVRFNRPIPINADDLRVYDNGSAELYLRRRTAPYEQ